MKLRSHLTLVTELDILKKNLVWGLCLNGPKKRPKLDFSSLRKPAAFYFLVFYMKLQQDKFLELSQMIFFWEKFCFEFFGPKVPKIKFSSFMKN